MPVENDAVSRAHCGGMSKFTDKALTSGTAELDRSSRSLISIERIIRHVGRELFYAGAGRWVDSFAAAKRFRSASEAALEAKVAGLRDCELVIRFDEDPHRETSLRLA